MDLEKGKFSYERFSSCFDFCSSVNADAISGPRVPSVRARSGAAGWAPRTPLPPPQQRSGTRWGRRAPPLRASGLLGALAETRAPARTSPAPGPRCHSRATEAAAAAPASGTRATRVGLGGGPAVRVRRSPLGDARRAAV